MGFFFAHLGLVCILYPDDHVSECVHVLMWGWGWGYLPGEE